MGIASREELQEHLEWAMAIEMLTIPPYLYALYSIKDPQSTAARLIRSIVAEEMLHLVLAANILVAVGGRPRFSAAHIVPSYPKPLPHHSPELIVGLEPCSAQVVKEVFMLIEQPKDLVTGMREDGEYHSLGDFYIEIETSINRLSAEIDLFAQPRLDRQLADESFYSPVEFDAEDSGGLHGVVDAETACRAIETIIHQGEGLRDHHWADPAHQELTHYYKLREIADGNAPLGDVWPLVANPTADDLVAPAQQLAVLFNAAYTMALHTLDELYEPLDAAERRRLISRLYGLMSGVMGPVAHELVTRPGTSAGEHSGPTFEWYDFADPQTARDELAELAQTVAPPKLAHLPDFIAAL